MDIFLCVFRHPSVFSWVKYLLKSFSSFRGLYCILITESSLYVLDTNMWFTKYVICKYFLQYHGLTSYSLVFWREVPDLYEAQIYQFFSSMDNAFGVASKKSLHNLSSQRFSPRFSPQSVSFLFYIGSLIHSKLTSVYGCQVLGFLCTSYVISHLPTK